MKNQSDLLLYLSIYSGLALVLLLIGCSPKVIDLPATPEPTGTQVVELHPYLTPTLESVATTIPTPTNQPALFPSPTPFLHTIVEGDTLLGIALQYGVELDDLRAYNPEIDPSILSVGETVIIPLGEDDVAVVPTESSLPISLAEPVCYRTQLKSMWCLLLAENNLEGPVESLSIQIALVNENGDIVASKSAAPPLDIIQAGASIPVMAYFPGPFDENVKPNIQVNSVFPANNLSERYIQLIMGKPVIVIGMDGLSAHVSGTLQIPQDSLPAEEVRVIAVAYSPNNEVIGVRVWEPRSELVADEAVAYQFTVYSLDDAIGRVEVFSEARP